MSKRTLLAILAHPDDESFGPAHAMAKQRREGHEVYLLSLTKGGATKQRHKYGYSVEEMGEIRYKEMLHVAEVLDLTELTVLDLPDSGLKEMDPREIEAVVREHMERIRPDVLVTYAVHGISGFHDHLVTHAVVKRAYVEVRDKIESLRRLAFYTLTEDEAKQSAYFPLSGSTEEQIDCVFEVDEVDIQASHRALDCYVTFQETIAKTRIKEFIHKSVVFEFFQETCNPPLTDLFQGLS